MNSNCFDATLQDRVKIAVELPNGEWHGNDIESLWAEPVGSDHFQISNVPFYAKALSFDDVVAAHEADGRLIYDHVVKRNGHSTYRVILREGITDKSPEFRSAWAPLEDLGCTYEKATDELLAIDVPPEADIRMVYELLERGEAPGVWDFEEGHCGHKLD